MINKVPFSPSQYGSVFMRECLDYLCSTPQVLPRVHALTFSPLSISNNRITGPMGADERDMGESSLWC